MAHGRGGSRNSSGGGGGGGLGRNSSRGVGFKGPGPREFSYSDTQKKKYSGGGVKPPTPLHEE